MVCNAQSAGWSVIWGVMGCLDDRLTLWYGVWTFQKEQKDISQDINLCRCSIHQPIGVVIVDIFSLRDRGTARAPTGDAKSAA